MKTYCFPSDSFDLLLAFIILRKATDYLRDLKSEGRYEESESNVCDMQRSKKNLEWFYHLYLLELPGKILSKVSLFLFGFYRLFLS